MKFKLPEGSVLLDHSETVVVGAKGKLDAFFEKKRLTPDAELRKARYLAWSLQEPIFGQPERVFENGLACWTLPNGTHVAVGSPRVLGTKPQEAKEFLDSFGYLMVWDRKKRIWLDGDDIDYLAEVAAKKSRKPRSKVENP